MKDQKIRPGPFSNGQDIRGKKNVIKIRVFCSTDDGCATTPEESDVSESDEETSQTSLASPGSYEDLVRLLSNLLHCSMDT